MMESDQIFIIDPGCGASQPASLKLYVRPDNFIDYGKMAVTDENRDELTGCCPPEVTKVVFLDIDNVLQPEGQYDRFSHLDSGDLPGLYKHLQEKTGLDYSRYDIFDVTAVYYDWEEESVTALKRVLDTAGAKIVLTSSWIPSDLYKMKVLFKIHDLDKYYIDNLKSIGYTDLTELRKSPEYKNITSHKYVRVLEYIKKNNHITNFVIIDDCREESDLDGHYICTKDKEYFTKEDADKCLKILQRRLRQGPSKPGRTVRRPPPSGK
jgi:hypothetical protein